MSSLAACATKRHNDREDQKHAHKFLFLHNYSPSEDKTRVPGIVELVLTSPIPEVSTKPFQVQKTALV